MGKTTELPEGDGKAAATVNDQTQAADKAWADWAQKTDDRLAALEKRELLGDPASGDMSERLANLEKAAGIYTPMPKQKGDTWQDTDKLKKDEAAAINGPVA